MCLVISFTSFAIAWYLITNGMLFSGIITALMAATVFGFFLRNALKNGGCVFLGGRDCKKTSKTKEP